MSTPPLLLPPFTSETAPLKVQAGDAMELLESADTEITIAAIDRLVLGPGRWMPP